VISPDAPSRDDRDADPDHEPVDRAAAFAAGPARIPRKFWYWAIAFVAVLGLGGSLLERVFSASGLNAPSVTPTTKPVVVHHRASPSAPPTLAAPLPAFMGAARLSPRPAPAFSLVDQAGQPTSLASARPAVVVLTFFDGRCDDICPVVAAELQAAETDLGTAADRVDFVTVNTDPLATAVSSLSNAAATGLGSLPNWRILTGPLATLNNVWRNYKVTVDVSRVNQAVSHTDVIYFIGPGGELRYSVTPFADENRGAGSYTLSPPLIDRFGHGIATYATLAAR